MSTAIANPEVRVYLDAVRSHLTDIPDRDLEDLLEDLEGHLLEVAAEDDGTLEDRLGPPAVYAEELRATAGLPTREPGRRFRRTRRMLDRFERSIVGRVVDAAGRSKVVAAVRAFLPELRPGWWVVRAYVVIAAVAILTANYGYGTNPFVPHIAGSYVFGLALLIPAIWLSVAAGRALLAGRGSRRLAMALNAVIVLTGIAAVAQAGDHTYYTYEEVYDSRPWLAHADGTPISNICPYASDGKPLSGVLLYDQDGRAIIDLAVTTTDGYPLLQDQPMIRNAFPRALYAPDPMTGEPRPLSCPSSPGTAPAPSSGVQPSASPGTQPTEPGS